MALIVETGLIVENANSYVSIADFDTYLADRGLTVSHDNTGKEALLINASDNLLSYEGRFKGSRLTAEQMLSWPRKDAVINGFLFGSNVIPQQAKNAQMQLAYQSITTALDTNSTGQEVIEQEVPGVIKQKFKDGTASSQPKFGKVEKLLAPLLKPITLSVTR